MAESDMGARSNYEAMFRKPARDASETMAEAARAQRRVTGWLLAIGGYDAGVLRAAYSARPWGLALREELGRTTGVVVRLAAAEVGLPDDDAQLSKLEVQMATWLSGTLETEGPRGLDAYRGKAVMLLQRAYRSYVRERGGSEKPSVWEGR